MSVFYVLIFLVASGCSLATNVSLPLSLSSEDYSQHSVSTASDYWPDKVALSKDYKLPDSGIVLKAGREAIFHRIENGLAVVDFGRYGTHHLAVSSTDLLSRYDESQLRGKPGPGLFSKRMFNKFFLDRKGEYQPGMESDFLGRNYFLIVYGDMASDQLIPATEWLTKKENLADLERLATRVLFMPSDASEKELLNDVRSVNWLEPVMYHWATEGFWKSFSFNVGEAPTFILIDKNGRVISSGKDLDYLSGLPEAIKEDQKLSERIYR